MRDMVYLVWNAGPDDRWTGTSCAYGEPRGKPPDGRC